jgi:hypothetical protein
MVSHDHKAGYVVLSRIHCKMWGCPACGPQNAVNWRAFLLSRFNKDFGHEKWCFVTITANKWAHRRGALDTLKNLQDAWKRLYDHLLRRYGAKNMQYVRVFEQHKSGRYHMHFLMNFGEAYDAHNFVIKDDLDEFRHPECKWLSSVMRKLRAGWRVHIRRVWEEETRTANVGLVVGYIVKYVGKQLVDLEFPKYQRRIQTSRKIGSPETHRKTNSTWERLREISQEFVLKSKKPVVDITTGEILSIASFGGESFYPPLEYYKGENP